MSETARPAGIELRHLHLMLAIAEHGSLTTVAPMLGLTQPGVSRRLRELELRLRSPLFERTARRMVPTPAGEHLIACARRIVADVDAIECQLMNGELSSPRGKVRVSTECYTAYHWLPPLLREFQVRWPSVELTVGPEHSKAPLTALRHGAIDVALVYRRTSDKQIRFEPLFDDEIVVVTAPDHPFAAANHVRVEALADEHLIVYGSLASGNSVVRDILEAADVQPARTTQVQLTEAILELVAAGFGVALLANWAVAPAVRSGMVRISRVGMSGYTRRWYAAVRAGDVTPAFQFDLIDMLRRHLSAGPVLRVSPQISSS
jgi:LysR family transcriptional regulator for metE and metH